MEHRPDVKLSNIRKYVEALGGRLEVSVVLPKQTERRTAAAIKRRPSPWRISLVSAYGTPAMPATGEFNQDIELIIQDVARVFAHEGNARMVSLLADGDLVADHVEHENWNGRTEFWTVILRVSQPVFLEVQAEQETLEKAIEEKIRLLIAGYTNIWIQGVRLFPNVTDAECWRE